MVKRFLLFLVAVGLMLGVSGIVAAYSSTTSLDIKGAGTASISGDWSNSPTHSAKLYAPFDNSNGPEGRVIITFNEVVTLNDITSISWMQNITNGYVSHVDVLIDTDSNGVSDDALVFEYAKVNPIDCDDVADYPTGVVNTFGDKGIVDNAAYAWLTSGPAGGCLSPPTEFFWHSLSAWKTGVNSSEANGKTISGATRVIALEIEVDGWIMESQSYIDDIMINGAVIENFESSEQTVNAGVIADLKLIATPNPINFGSTLKPGQESIQSITLTPGTSDLDISVSISSAASFIAGMEADWEGSYSIYNGDNMVINANTPKTFNTKITVPTGTKSGAYTGVITYTVLEYIPIGP